MKIYSNFLFQFKFIYFPVFLLNRTIQYFFGLQGNPHDLLFMKLIVIHDIDYDMKISFFSLGLPKKRGNLFTHLNFFSILSSINYFAVFFPSKYTKVVGGGFPEPPPPHPQGGVRTIPPLPFPLNPAQSPLFSRPGGVLFIPRLKITKTQIINH